MNRRSIRFAMALALISVVALSAAAATVNGGTLTVARSTVTIQPNGSAVILLSYTNAATATVHMRALIVDSACTQVVDQYGTVVANPAPASLCTAIASFTGQLDTLIANGATAGKLNL